MALYTLSFKLTYEDRNVALTAGTEYIIIIAANGTDSQGVIEVRMASGTDSASLESNIVPASVPASPLWLLGVMASLLSFVGIRRLRKA